MPAKHPPMRARVAAPSAAIRLLDSRPLMWACIPRPEPWESVGEGRGSSSDGSAPSSSATSSFTSFASPVRLLRHRTGFVGEARMAASR
jgi:hypothetical protein